jgi:hypothetical protein
LTEGVYYPPRALRCHGSKEAEGVGGVRLDMTRRFTTTTLYYWWVRWMSAEFITPCEAARDHIF